MLTKWIQLVTTDTLRSKKSATASIHNHTLYSFKI